jgi:hypothetical protein
VNGNGYRAQLRSVVTASAAPHGYTLTLWTSGALTIRAAGGAPSVIEVLLLLVGAVAGFGMVGLLAYGSLNEVLSPAPPAIRLWAALHLLSVGACVLLVYGVTVLAHGWMLWPLAGFTATATYFLILGAQFQLATTNGRIARPQQTSHERARD